MPSRMASRGDRRYDGRPVEQELPASEPVCAEDGARHLGPPRPDQSREPDDLAGPDPERDVREPGPRQPARLEAHRAEGGGGGASAVGVADGPAHHARHQEVLVDLRHPRVAHEPPVAEHGHGLRDLEDLGQVVGDVEARQPARGEAAEVVEQPTRLQVRERGGRLVEDQHLGLGGDGLQDLHHLLRGRAERAHRRGRIEPLEIEQGEELARLAVQQGEVDVPEPLHRLAVREDVLGDAQRRHQRELLEDDGDPVADGFLRGRERHRAPVEEDRSLVRLVNAGQGEHERALAGAVLPHHRVGLARPDAQVHAVQRAHAREGLHDVARLEHEFGHVSLGTWPAPPRCGDDRGSRRAAAPPARAEERGKFLRADTATA